MELSAANLNALFVAADLIFQRGFETPATYYEKLCSVVKSSTKQNIYPFMGRTTQFSEWLGTRLLQNLETHAYTLQNKHYENTIGIDLDDISDDQFGVYEPMIQQLGEDARVHPDLLLGTMLKNAVATIDAPSAPGAVIGYDGKTFFSASHPVGLEGAAPTNTPNVNTGGTGPYWFLVDSGRAIRPFLFQSREPYRLVRMNSLVDEKVFNEKKLRFGVDGRVNVGVAFWQLCYASNQDLSNPTNFGAAVAAMRSINTDAGQPFRAWSSAPTKKYLMVPPSLEELGNQLLHASFGAIAGASGAVAGVPGTNIYLNACELIVNEFLG